MRATAAVGPAPASGFWTRWRDRVGLIVTGLLVLVFSVALVNLSQDAHPLSVIDEHIHFDTAVRALDGDIPWRGALLGPELVQEWACGVGHEAGGLPYPCGDERLSAASLPSGQYTTGYIHYPTYFFAAAGFHHVAHALTGTDDLLGSFRLFSALTMILGVIACGVFAWLLRLRGAALAAAVFVPLSSTMMLIYATIINPSSTSVLSGALIAGTTLLWIRRNRGFVWVALAIGAASAIAVTSSLPAGATLIAMLIVLIGRRWGLRLTSPWNPRWWQFAVLWLLVLAPIVIWGRVIAARATIPDEVLYGYLPIRGKKDIAVGAVHEIASLHSPWNEVGIVRAGELGLLARVAQAFSQGVPLWITVAVFGSLVVYGIVSLRRAHVARAVLGAGGGEFGARTGWLHGWTFSPIGLFAFGALATIVLYPPALRISNWLTMGFDHPITSRYSNAFAPLLVLALLLWLPRRPVVHGVAAVVGVIGTIGAVVAGL